MNRRQLVTALLALPAPSFEVAQTSTARALAATSLFEISSKLYKSASAKSLTPSGPVVSNVDGQVIENLDIEASVGNGITVLHQGVVVRHCRIRHAGGHGVSATGATNLILQELDINHVGAPLSGVAANEHCNNVNLDSCASTILRGIKASKGSSNIYVESSERIRMSLLELHDARGPTPRGQNVQFNRSPNSLLEDFSAENGPTSWTEDNVSVFRSDRCIVRRGLVSYNNSPSGDGVMIEGSFDCLVEDVDALRQGNGAFAAVPQGEAGCGGCTFLRCRTRQTYNAPRDGRAAPSSGSLSIYTLTSAGAQRHTITDCQYDELANPRNLIWDLRAVNPGWTFKPGRFVPRPPIRLAFDW
ncbi:MAG: right-handed parallel beta-helix repeat-containing protein [Methylobacteriaceae bacterium]|nr:right-handed parallel beta-helix repeat-containing protein [Methylobacteriaceae bacterium]